jgi:hypothetical protein
MRMTAYIFTCAITLIAGTSLAKDILLTDCKTNGGVTRCTVSSASNQEKNCCYFRNLDVRVLDPKTCQKEGGTVGEHAASEDPAISCKRQ